MNTNTNLLYKDLSYQVQGAMIEVRKGLGSGHKESVYQKALAEEFNLRGIGFEREKSIKIFSPKTGKILGMYRPDFIIDNKIILEVKVSLNLPSHLVNQLYDYLRNSDYELGYLVNFASARLYIKRFIFTNNMKTWR